MAFDETLAKLTVKLSRSVYRSAERARTDTAALGLGEFRFFAHEPNEAMTVTDAGHLYLAFRGTEARVRDWVQNSEFGPIPGELGGKVHSGFHNGLSDLWSEIAPVVEASGKPVVLTGHSLGGALAVLAAARLAESGRTVTAVHTYGQPRVGHADFTNPYGERLGAVTYRVINHVDVVTRIPLLIQRYRHVGTRIYFDGGGKMNVDAGAWRIALDDAKFRLTHFGRITEAAGLPLHNMSAYVNLVEAL